MARFLLDARSGASPRIQIQDDPTGAITVQTTDRTTVLRWGAPAGNARSALMVHHDDGQITVTVDSFGLYPAVIHAAAGRTLVASDLATLLDARPDLAHRPSPQGLVALLTVGQCLGTDTPWQGVTHVPAGSIVTCAPGRPPVRVLDVPTVLPAARTTPQQALDALVAAVDRHLTALPATMIPLSGGLDSRLLLACAVAAGHRPDTLCYGDPASADRRIAADLAAAADCVHIGRCITADRIQAAAPAIARTGGGEVPVHHGHGVIGALAMDDLHGRPVMTGTGSEAFRAFYYDRGLPGMSLLSTPFAHHLRAKAAGWVTEHFGVRRLAGLPASLSDPVRCSLEAAVTAHLDAAPDLARGLDAVYLGLRVGRFVVAGQQLLNAFHPRLHPFLDPEVVTALSGLPVGWKLGARFHRWAIARLAPDLATVTWDRTSRPLASGLQWQERWPGLAARLGQRAHYAKAGVPLADYGAWAGSVDTTVLIRRVLDRLDVSAAEGAALAAWMPTLDHRHLAGTLAALDGAAAEPLKGAA